MDIITERYLNTLLINSNDIVTTITPDFVIKDFNKKAEEYFTDVVYGIQTNSEKIQETISSNLASNWKIERISKISLVLLKLSTYELIYKSF